MECEVGILKDHPRNSYFFDDITGEKWNEFLLSIKRNGVLTPLVVTPEYIIVSGHQRKRACVELGIPRVKCDIVQFASEDDVLLALIDSNIRQRGIVNSPSVKLGRILLELERIKNAQENGRTAESATSKKAIQEQVGIDRKVASRAKTLATLPDGYEELLNNGVISARTAIDIVSKLKPEEQVELFKSLDATQRYTQKQIQQAVTAHFPQAEYVCQLEQKLADYQNMMSKEDVEMADKMRELEQKERTTYEELMAERRARKQMQAEYEKRLQQTEQIIAELQAAQATIDSMEETNDMLMEYETRLHQCEEERDELSEAAKMAKNDADLLLVCAIAQGFVSALSEASADETPFTGALVENAQKILDRMDDTVTRIKLRIAA